MVICGDLSTSGTSQVFDKALYVKGNVYEETHGVKTLVDKYKDVDDMEYVNEVCQEDGGSASWEVDDEIEAIYK